MKIAALQMQAVSGDIEANLDRIAAAASQAGAKGASLLIAPELAVTGYGAGDRFAELASTLDGTVSKRLDAIASDSGVAVVAGFAEQAESAVFNSALFTDGAGNRAIYRKSHLYGPYERSHFRAEAPASVLVTHRGLKLGMLICYDVEFPENVRRLAKAGADLVVVPTALPAGDSGSFIAKHMIQVRAFENQIFVAYVNHCGSDDKFDYAGLSRIAAPDGSLLAAASAVGENLLVADIRPLDFDQSRSENTYLADLNHPT
jgi:predicted amidohydrolase